MECGRKTPQEVKNKIKIRQFQVESFNPLVPHAHRNSQDKLASLQNRQDNER